MTCRYLRYLCLAVLVTLSTGCVPLTVQAIPESLLKGKSFSEKRKLSYIKFQVSDWGHLGKLRAIDGVPIKPLTGLVEASRLMMGLGLVRLHLLQLAEGQHTYERAAGQATRTARAGTVVPSGVDISTIWVEDGRAYRRAFSEGTIPEGHWLVGATYLVEVTESGVFHIEAGKSYRWRDLDLTPRYRDRWLRWLSTPNMRSLDRQMFPADSLPLLVPVPDKANSVVPGGSRRR